MVRDKHFWHKLDIGVRLGRTPFFKLFVARPCADRSQYAEHEDIKFDAFRQRLPLPLENFRLLQ